MFINYTKKFIYLRVPKTGSTSMQNHLIETAGSDNVKHTKGDRPYGDHTPKGISRFVDFHINVEEMLAYKIINEQDLDTLSVNAVVRDPAERILSQCANDIVNSSGSYSKEKLNERVEAALYNVGKTNKTNFRRQTHWLTINGKLIDRIWLYEDVQDLSLHLTGLPLTKHYRSEYKKIAQPSVDDIEPSLLLKINELYANDIEIYKRIESIPKELRYIFKGEK